MHLYIEKLFSFPGEHSGSSRHIRSKEYKGYYSHSHCLIHREQSFKCPYPAILSLSWARTLNDIGKTPATCSENLYDHPANKGFARTFV